MTATGPTETDILLHVLAERRAFVLLTARGLTDEQARLTPTVSTLSIGGLVKHLSATEDGWARFLVEGASAIFDGEIDWTSDELADQHRQEFTLLEGETLAGVVADYAATAERTERIVRELPSLDVDHELPPAPWFEPGARWSARRVLAHLVGETAQHSGHADIIRETIDGQRSMG